MERTSYMLRLKLFHFILFVTLIFVGTHSSSAFAASFIVDSDGFLIGAKQVLIDEQFYSAAFIHVKAADVKTIKYLISIHDECNINLTKANRALTDLLKKKYKVTTNPKQIKNYIWQDLRHVTMNFRTPISITEDTRDEKKNIIYKKVGIFINLDKLSAEIESSDVTYRNRLFWLQNKEINAFSSYWVVWSLSPQQKVIPPKTEGYQK